MPSTFVMRVNLHYKNESKLISFIEMDFGKMGTKTSLGLSTLLAKLKRPRLVCNFRDCPLTQLLESKLESTQFITLTCLNVANLVKAGGNSISSKFSFLGWFLEYFSLKKPIESRALSFLETYFKPQVDGFMELFEELSDPRKKQLGFGSKLSLMSKKWRNPKNFKEEVLKKILGFELKGEEEENKSTKRRNNSPIFFNRHRVSRQM